MDDQLYTIKVEMSEDDPMNELETSASDSAQRDQTIDAVDTSLPLDGVGHVSCETPSSSLVTYTRIRQLTKRFPCRSCDKKCSSLHNLRQHERSHQRIAPRKQSAERSAQVCLVCNKTLASQQSLDVHLAVVHSDERPFKCTECDDSFKLKAVLRNHILMHENAFPYQCALCPRVFRRKYRLADHTKHEHEGQPKKPAKKTNYYCPICQKSFASYKHKRTHSDERPYMCEICGKSFKYNAHLSLHFVTHGQERAHECDVCHHRFTTSGALNMHKRTHTGEKPFACEVCGQAFRQRATCRRHIQIVHNGERPHQCPECQKTFTRLHHMQRHRQSHYVARKDLPRNEKCAECDKAFLNKSELAKHKATHTGEKRFCCEVCGIRVSQRVHLRRHMLIHENKREFQCKVCEKEFRRAEHLNYHVKAIHENAGKPRLRTPSSKREDTCIALLELANSSP